MGETNSTGAVANLVTLINALGREVNGFWMLLAALCYVGGIVCFLMGVLYLYRKADPSSRNAYGTMPNAWAWSMFVGILLFAFPETMATVSNSIVDLGTDNSALTYGDMLAGRGPALGTCQLNGIYPLLRVIGAFFMFNAVLHIRKLGVYGLQAAGGFGPWTACFKFLGGVGLLHMQAILIWIYSNTGIALSKSLC